jgi:hypothetical protein
MQASLKSFCIPPQLNKKTSGMQAFYGHCFAVVFSVFREKMVCAREFPVYDITCHRRKPITHCLCIIFFD